MWNIPAWREAGFVQDQRLFGIGDDAFMVMNREMTGCLADVDPVVAVGGMAHDPFVLFVKRIHGWPGEGDPIFQLARVRGQVYVSPCSSGRAVLAGPDGIPGCQSKIGVMVRILANLKSIWRDGGLREISHRITARLEEQEDVLAVSDPVFSEAHAHPPAQRLNVQQSLG